jgi:branched-chain amino acid transport system substrate-binding protein
VKKVLFLLFTCLLLVALVIPACEGGGVPAGNVIKIGVIGPMEYIQGKHHWAGAEMARDEINAAGGVKVGDETYMIKLIKADSNEINSITDAAAAMEKLISVDKADFIVGGFRTEAVFPMQETAMDNKKIFLNCGAATLALNTPVKTNYDRYKYYFRNTPFCSTYLVQNTVYEIGMAGAIIKEDTGIKRPLRVAICAEGAQWADTMVLIMKSWVPSKLGMEVSGVWRPSPTATELTAEMHAMEAANTDIICPIISGPLGIPYARSWGELKVPAASVGINVESQQRPFWDVTKGFGNYETSLSSYCENMEPTTKTKPFVDAFVAKMNDVPTYTAGTYDAIYILKGAVERAGTLDSDAVVTELEKTDFITTVSRFVYTGMDAPLNNPHDVTYGPGYATGIATQWQDGKSLGVWPNADYATEDAWKAVKYTGVARWMAPPVLVDKLKAEVGKEPAAPETPAAPPAGEQPAAPPSEQPAAAATSYAAKTYTNDTYGFSIQYPKDWVERPELMIVPNYLAAFGVAAFVPGVTCSVFDNPGPETTDWVLQSFKDLKSTDPKIRSDIKEETLAGGKAYTYKANYISATGYEIAAYVLDVDRDGKRIRINVFTIDAFAPYDETLFSEIAHTLTFK